MQKLFLLALFVVSANAFTCSKDICSRVRCSSVDSCNGRVTKGLCGCCDVCIVSLREGETCNPYPFLGIPHLAECGFNLVCSKLTRTCIKPLNLYEGGCQTVRSESLSKGLLGAFTPICDTDGSYAPVQCHGSVCKCVTKEGEQIRNYKGMIGTMNCRCARDQHTYFKAGLLGKMFMCEANGNYKKVQCLGSVCFCSDEFGKQIGNTGVHIAHSNSLNC